MLSGATREDTRDMVREMQRAVTDTAAKYEAEYGLNPVTFVLAEEGLIQVGHVDALDYQPNKKVS